MKVLRSFESIRFSVPGQAVASPRAGRSRLGHSYTPKPAVDHKTAIRWALAQAVKVHKFTPPMDALVELEIVVARVLPKSAPRWMRQLVDEKEIVAVACCPEPVPCPTKPDWDNYGKLVSDALNGLAYRDDGQVFRGSVTKVYAGTAETRIDVTYWRWEDEA